MLVGGNSPTQGFTDRARQAAETFGPGVMLWMPSAGPQDALAFPDAIHLVRLDNWTVDITPEQYAASVTQRVIRWRAAIPDTIFVLGNEPDLEASHNGEQIARYAAAMKAAFPGVKVGNPPLSVDATGLTVTDGCDACLIHTYWGFEAPSYLTDPRWGRNYLPFVGKGLPVYIGEVNASPANRDPASNWTERNRQVAQWLNQAEFDGIAGACLFLLDAAPDWASFDVGPESAAQILALRHQQPAPPPIPPPPPVPPASGAYSRSSDPRGFRDVDPRWYPFIRQHNPGEADAIMSMYSAVARTIDYDANCMIAQGCVETEMFTSPRWRNAHAAAGIGIYGDGTPDVIWGPLPHGDVQTGIRAQADLLTAYFGNDEEPFGTLAPHGFGGMTLHKTMLSDMDGVWAADRGYSAAIVGYLAEVVGGAIIVAPTWVTGEEVVAQAMADLGRDTFLDEGVVVPSYYRCEEAVEVWEERCGLSRLRYSDAKMDAHSGPLNQGVAPVGARVFFEGPGWSEFDHVGTALGDGRTISALAVVTISDGWQDPALGYLGWRYAPGVGPTPVEEVDVHTDGKFDAGREHRLWDGPKTKAQIKKVGGIDLNRGVDARWQEELHAGRPVGYAVSNEEAIPTGGVIRYFSSGFICSYPDGTTTVN